MRSRSNLYGTAIGTKLSSARTLPARGGRIVNAASVAGRTPLSGMATYAATTRLVGLTKSLHREYPRKGRRSLGSSPLRSRRP